MDRDIWLEPTVENIQSTGAISIETAVKLLSYRMRMVLFLGFQATSIDGYITVLPTPESVAPGLFGQATI